MPSLDLIAWIAVWALTGAIVGAGIGWRSNRLLLGLVLGAVLGPIGWLVMAWLRADLRECPACSQQIPSLARVCPRCGANLRTEQRRSSRSQFKRVSEREPW